MWFADFPGAVVPLWQLEHVPLSLEWSSRDTVHDDVVWQASQAALVAMCVPGLPVAADPLWHAAHAPVTAA